MNPWRLIIPALLLAGIKLPVAHDALSQKEQQGRAIPPAQSVPTPLPIGPADPQTLPVPEWLVWRVFHDSLVFYGRTSPLHVQRLLAERMGLTDGEAEAVLNAGQDYLQRIDSIDEEARSEIQSRFGSNRLPTPPPDGIPRPPHRKANIAPPPPIWDQIVPGRSVRATLIAEGFVQQVERRKEQALEGHKRALIQSVGYPRLLLLERWLQVDVAPRVRVFSQATPIPAPPRSESGRFRLGDPNRR